MFILKTGHQPGVYVPLRALFLVFDLINLILAGKEDMHESLDELNFGKFATELLPLIDVRIEFLLNILKTNGLIKTKFCIHIITDKIYFGIVNRCFSQIGNRVTALD